VAVLPIRLFGDPVLTTPAEPVTTFDAELRRLVLNLDQTLYDQRGSGLAAPQVGVGLRVFVFHDEDVAGHLVNPVLDFPDQEEQDGLEGCLSIPGLYFDTKRRMNVVAKGYTADGDPVQVVGAGNLARCLQHETDHLDGVLFIDRMDRERRKAAMRAIREAERNHLAPPTVKLSPHPIAPEGVSP
jgi:peptide deformylase